MIKMKDLSKTILKKKPTKAYVDEKVARLDKLIEEAPNEETKAAYQNYKDFWIGQLSSQALSARKKKKNLEDELANAEKKAEEDAILEEITAEKEFAAREAKRVEACLKADKAALQVEADEAMVQEREQKALSLLDKIRELETQIKQSKIKEEEDGEIKESESESPIND